MDCWQGAFTYEACCHARFGPAGNPICWNGPFTADNCCVGDEARDAKFASLQTQLGCDREGLEQQFAELSRQRSLSPRRWWREHIATLHIAEEKGPLSPLLARPVHVNLPLLLKSLVPADERNLFAVNIGAGDGMTHDPVYPLFSEHKYSGLVVEALEWRREQIEDNLSPLNSTGGIQLCIEAVLPQTVGTLLTRYQVPVDLDVLKVDIDCFDASILQAILVNGYRPKVVMVEVNPDIPPPIQWRVEHSATFRWEIMEILDGVYGASPDAFFSLLSQEHGYSLVAFELLDVREDCPLCEHNMYFVDNSVLGRSFKDPLVSWEGMNRLFWSQLMNRNRSHWCLHMHRMTRCPLHEVVMMATEFGSNAWLHEPSRLLDVPLYQQKMRAYAERLNNKLVTRSEAWDGTIYNSTLSITEASELRTHRL